MDEILTNFENTIDGIEQKRKEMLSLYDANEAVREYVRLQHEKEILEEEKRRMKPAYYEAKMRLCNHVFAECSRRSYDWEIEVGDGFETDYSIYSLFVDHYCLKCGCLTYKIKPFYLDKYGIADTPTAKVNYMIQRRIAESAENYSIIDCNGISNRTVIVLWNRIKRENQGLPFNNLIEIFQTEIEKLKSDIKDPSAKILKPTVFEHRYVAKK